MGCAAAPSGPEGVANVSRSATTSASATSHPSRSTERSVRAAGPDAAARRTRNTSEAEYRRRPLAHRRRETDSRLGYARINEHTPVTVSAAGGARCFLFARHALTVSAKSRHVLAARAASFGPTRSSTSSRSSAGSASHRSAPERDAVGAEEDDGNGAAAAADAVGTDDGDTVLSSPFVVSAESASTALSTEHPHCRYTSSIASAGSASPNIAASISGTFPASPFVPRAARLASLAGASRRANAGRFALDRASASAACAAASLRSKPWTWPLFPPHPPQPGFPDDLFFDDLPPPLALGPAPSSSSSLDQSSRSCLPRLPLRGIALARGRRVHARRAPCCGPGVG